MKRFNKKLKIIIVLIVIIFIAFDENQSKVEANDCATFDSSSNVLFIPCVTLGSYRLWVKLQSDTLGLLLTDYGFESNGTTDSNCSTFDPTENLLHVPCVKFQKKVYWVDLNLTSNDPILLEVKDYGETSVPSTKDEQIKFVVGDNQTIQEVIDECPINREDIENDRSGSNTCIVQVPSNHKKEFYSLVRNSQGDFVDHRNVNVIFQDNPQGKFKYDLFEDCNDTSGWKAGTGSTISINEGKCHLTATEDQQVVFARFVFDQPIDLHQYQGVMIDLEYVKGQVLPQIQFIDSSGKSEHRYDALHLPKGQRTIDRVFFGLPLHGNINYSNIKEIRIRGLRASSYSGSLNLDFDNIYFVSTFYCNVASIRFDDDHIAQYLYINHLEKRGWKSAFVVYTNAINGPNKISLNQLQELYEKGHNIINHGEAHADPRKCDYEATYEDFWNGRNWLYEHGFSKYLNMYAHPFVASNMYLRELLLETHTMSIDPQLFGFPIVKVGLTNPDFNIPEDAQKRIKSHFGGIYQFVFHRIENEDNFEKALEFIEENFSYIITPQEILEHLPNDIYPLTNVSNN
ncbi:MAG TPA: hypothetical protein ENJ28_06070 [Gammaproteobacteria bacterium]|nr:hypothetical protein [Gammaproteobacteria bacterium]